MYRRREKTFGSGPRQVLDIRTKWAIWHRARVWNQVRRQPRQHLGPLTRTTLHVLWVLLFRFAGQDGRPVYPSYAAIAAACQCSTETVRVAIHALEQGGILTWVHRLAREKRPQAWGSMWRVVRSSNAYRFFAIPAATNAENLCGQPNQVHSTGQIQPPVAEVLKKLAAKWCMPALPRPPASG
jgi:hypothetical protein